MQSSYCRVVLSRIMESQELGRRSGAAFIEAGQNLYDQPPFSEILQTLSEELGLELNTLREYVSTFCNGIRNANQSQIDHIPGEMIRGYIHYLKKPLRPVIKKVVEKMQGYPDWVIYLGNVGSTGSYKGDGNQSARERRLNQFPVETYVSWAHKKLELEGKLGPAGISVGIEAVFPQDFASQTPALVLPRGGSRKERIRRRILETT